MDSIRTIMIHNLWDKVYKNRVVKTLESLQYNQCRKITDKNMIKNLLQLLEGAWFNELALIDSLNESALKFAHWDIVKFYYTIYFGVSIMSRIVCKDTTYKTQKEMVNLFNNQVLRGPLKELILPPFYLTYQNGKLSHSYEEVTPWMYGIKYHCPRIEKG
ncbi:hypothetical protein KY361_07760, partial [Candidatus Woesearchaeota archaeon]|nr:hypothetical protein [Candidatus Woesearchaeota archaeon]